MIQTTDSTCGEVTEILEAFLDGDLPAAEAGRVKGHLERCPSCAAELDLAAAIQRELRALPQLDCPPEVLERVRRAGRATRATPADIVPLRRTPLWAALAAAVLALTVGGGALVVQRIQQQPSPEEVARAEAEARFALAYVGQASRRAGLDLRDEVLRKRLIDPTSRTLAEALGEGPEDAPRTAER
jgi:anti-sigma factor (TIGR02949 family)